MRTRTLGVIAAAAFGAAALPSSAVAAGCHTTTQSIVKRHHIGCHEAERVADRAFRALRDAPECKGDRSATWRGWRIVAVGDLGIDIRFVKGDRSFHVTGGGACG
ncbi:MAG TPA: hypothetical protein VFR97_11505 [Capillimicrobium sp.]|nr:hypothetical protein [Capillimicrobium sp.]